MDTSPLNTATYSISTLSGDADIINMFSINNRSLEQQKNETALSDRRTISEISDDIFSVKPDTNMSKVTSQKPYKQKVVEHLKRIREKAGTPSRDVDSKTKIRRENENLNAAVDMVRRKLNLRSTTVLHEEQESFFNFSSKRSEKVCLNYIYLKLSYIF